MDPSVARRMWLVGEPIHALTYFAPESFAAWEREVAMRPWRALGEDRTAELERLLRPLAEAVSRSGVVRFPNPMGLPPTEPR